MCHIYQITFACLFSVFFFFHHILKGYSDVSLIHSLTHLDTKYDPPSRDKVCGPLANVVLASSETTAQEQYTAADGSKYKSPSKSHK